MFSYDGQVLDGAVSHDEAAGKAKSSTIGQGAINSYPTFQKQINQGNKGSATGLLFSVYTLGQLAGAWFAGPIADRFGRRVGMLVGACIIIGGSVLAATSNARGQFLAARFVLGLGICIITTAAPSYCVEIAPPQWRGRMTSIYNVGWFGGSIPAGAVTLGTGFIKSNLSWKLPLLGQCVPAGAVIALTLFMPESPRWLYMQGRIDEARAFLTRFHGHGDAEHPIVLLQIEEFQAHIMFNASDKRWWDYRELISTSAQRWRSAMVVLMAVFGQLSGSGLGYFNPVIFEALGYSHTLQLVLNLLVAVVSAIAALTAVALADRLTRRGVLICGTFVSACMLALNSGLTAVWDNAPADQKDLRIGRAAVAGYFFFMICYSFTYTPLQALYPVESLQTSSRAKGMALYAFIVNASNWLNLYVTPIAFERIGYRYIYVFVAWDICETVIWYFFAIETSGRTLEELEEIFQDPKPVRASKMKKRVIVRRDGGLVWPPLGP
ncbi:general substrate transporter [Atractiella rhizophila]|nr:general substrate transporter [Atractiella rhizophila]